MTVLELRDVGLVYQTSVPVVALDGVDLRIDQGELVAITGPSGGGKSSLLNVLGLLEQPTSGEYFVDGQPIRTAGTAAARARSDTFAFIFQGFHLLDRRPVIDSVELGLHHRGVPTRQRHARALEALATVGLADRADQPAHTLSGGQQQRVAIARALATGAPVLLADEPTGNLDSANSLGVLEALRQVNDAGVTVVVVTHDPQVALWANRHVTVLDGQVVADRSTVSPPQVTAPQPDGRSSHIRFGDAVRDVAASLRSRPGRTAGLVLAVTAAVGLSVATVGLGTSASAQVSAEFDERANRWVTAAMYEPEIGTTTVGWTPPGPDAVAERLQDLAGVQAATLVISHGQHPLAAMTGRKPVDSTVYSATSGFAAATESTIDWFDEDHVVDAGQVLVGQTLAGRLELGPREAAPVIIIDGHRVAIAGLITDSGRTPELLSAVVGDSADTSTFGRTEGTQAYLVTTTGAAQQVATQAPLAIDPVTPESVQVSAPADPRDLRATIEREVTVSMTVLAGVALLAAMLALANAMVMAVNERRAEIALRRAVGARVSHVVRLVLGEAVVTGGIGGVAGLYAGFAGVLAVTVIRHWSPVFDLRLAPIAVIGGTVIGAVGGLLAASAAARVHPAQALRE